jgi:hypothetical protein
MLYDSIYRVLIPKTFMSRRKGMFYPFPGNEKTEEKGQDYRETSYGKFERTITLALPQDVETDKIAARCEHGVLEIRVPLPAQLAGRKDPDSD